MFRPSIAARGAGLACAVSALVLAGGAHAQALPHYFLTLTETTAGLQVTSNLPTSDNYDPNVLYPDVHPSSQSNSWQVGPQPGGFHPFDPVDATPGSIHYNAIAWTDPGTGNYNALSFARSGNLGDIIFGVTSDVSASDLAGFYNYGGFGTSSVNFYTACFGPSGTVACPILADGQTFTTAISLFSDQLGSLSVTYSDHDALAPVSTGVPEPAAWALMIAGFGLAGATLRRRGRLQPA